MSAVSVTIFSDGRPMSSALEVLSIDIRREVNRIPQAELRVVDGDSARRRFAISDGGFFDPGSRIEIKIRYEGKPDTTVWKGVVVRHGMEAGPGGYVLSVGMKDAACKLAGARQSVLFQKKTDSAIIKELITDAGLSAGDIPDTRPEHPEMVRYGCSAWDFIVSRAEAQGLLVVAEDGRVSASRIELAGPTRHKFEHGIGEIYELEIEADAGSQYEAIESVAWDLKEQKLTDPQKASGAPVAPGDLESAKLGREAGQGRARLTHPVPVLADELKAWADGRLLRSQLALCRGRLVVPGRGDIRPMDIIEIAGVGRHFRGKTLITGLRHRVDRQGWRTDVQFGLPSTLFAQSPDIADAPAAGLLPAVSGLQIGVVESLDEDPDDELRVEIRLPAVDAGHKTLWARLSAPDAGKGRGYVFRPEPRDEVVVGFFNNDPRHPVILGALYGSKNTVPDDLAPSDKNEHRGIVTKKGTTIGFVDSDKASVYIRTPNKNKLLLDDDEEEIRVSDQHGNQIVLSKDGVLIKSSKDLKIEASGDVEIKGRRVDIK